MVLTSGDIWNFPTKNSNTEVVVSCAFYSSVYVILVTPQSKAEAKVTLVLSAVALSKFTYHMKMLFMITCCVFSLFQLKYLVARKITSKSLTLN